MNDRSTQIVRHFRVIAETLTEHVEARWPAFVSPGVTAVRPLTGMEFASLERVHPADRATIHLAHGRCSSV
jgi:hypothetical protein